MPKAILRAFCINPFNSSIILQGRYYYYYHFQFSGEETDAGKYTHSEIAISQGSILNPGNLALEYMLDTWSF